VFAGELGGRPIAVKRLLRQFVELARKEIGALILADEHPNIVRCGNKMRKSVDLLLT
jgi:serine/threonine-protein kinase/endoribonuclease IRE1